MNAAFRTMSLLALLASGMTQLARAEAPSAASSSTALGPNAMLADGSQALFYGQWEKGIHLTLIGLDRAVSNEERAIGYANLCAGYVALKKHEHALEKCDQSLAIINTNWRTWQNRAAANLELDRIDECMRDIERGLTINPHSSELQATLAIARQRAKLQQQQLRALVET